MVQGRQRGFVTFEDIQAVVPNSDEAVEALDGVYAALAEAGIPVRDAIGEEVAPEEEVAAASANLIDETMSDALLSDSVRMYLREIGQVPLLNLIRSVSSPPASPMDKRQLKNWPTSTLN